jgi:hypothetical protein
MLKTYLLATTFLAGLAGVAAAQSFNGEVGGHISTNADGDLTYEATLNLGAEAAVTESVTVIGNVTILGFDNIVENDIVIDGWYLGARTGDLALTFGDQSDLFALGDGLNEVGGNVLANPEADEQNLQAIYRNYSFMVGVTDITKDHVEVTNMQVAVQHSYTNGTNVYGVVDYNRATEDFTIGTAIDYTLDNKVVLSGAVTYQEVLAYQAGVSYNNLTGYIAGDEADTLAEAGVGYEWNVGAAGAFAEVAYDFRTDEATPAVGVSFKF